MFYEHEGSLGEVTKGWGRNLTIPPPLTPTQTVGGKGDLNSEKIHLLTPGRKRKRKQEDEDLLEEEKHPRIGRKKRFHYHESGGGIATHTNSEKVSHRQRLHHQHGGDGVAVPDRTPRQHYGRLHHDQPNTGHGGSDINSRPSKPIL